tara:strand:+ start:2138 stop:2368 length:231 start_codon:yes stop_codon:yes gene_type:complete
MWITHNISLDMDTDIEIDIDEFVEEHSDEILKSLDRLSLIPKSEVDHAAEYHEIMHQAKAARQLVTTIIRRTEDLS